MQDLDVDVRIILKWALKEEIVGLDWNGVAQEDDSLWAVLNTVMRLHVP